MTSVIVPVFNAGSVLDTTVPSVLALEGVDEWIWVNDGSTDDTQTRLSALLPSARAMRIVRLEENRGRGAARNAGVEAAKGGVLVFFDADVEPHSEAAARLVSTLEGPDTIASVARVRSVLDRPRDPYQRYLSRHARGARPTSGPVAWRYFLSGACALRRQSLDDVGGFDEDIVYGEDFDLACRLAGVSPRGLRLAETEVAVHNVGTLASALENASAFGHSLARMAGRSPKVVQIAEIPRVATHSFFAPFLPSPELLLRLVHGLPDSVQPKGVRVALGLSLLRGFHRG